MRGLIAEGVYNRFSRALACNQTGQKYPRLSGAQHMGMNRSGFGEIVPAATAAVAGFQNPDRNAAGDDDGNTSRRAIPDGVDYVGIGVSRAERRQHDSARACVNTCPDMGGIAAGIDRDNIDADTVYGCR